MARTYTFNIEAEQRKELAQAIGDYFGEKAKYTMPGFRYVIAGKAEILKDGSIILADEITEGEEQGLLNSLSEQGYEATREEYHEEPAADQNTESEPIKADIAVPMEGHTGTSLRNLINLFYQRQRLLNKATGGNFRVEKALTDRLLENGNDDQQGVLGIISEEPENLSGIEFSADRITFTGFPETDDPSAIQAYMQLAALVNKQALAQHRIVAKEVDDANEKYAFRIWLIRIGMTGNEYKQTRRILLSKLSGNCAFRTDEQLKAFSQKQKDLRKEVKAAEEAATDNAEATAQEGASDNENAE